MRKLKKEPCIDCGKLEVYATNRCRACYAKYYRNTKTGKACYLKYNGSEEARASSKKYRANVRAMLPPKLPMPLCACGIKSIAKGLCRKCYQRARYVPIPGTKPRPNSRGNRKTKPKKSVDVKFKEVLELVSVGFTISKALNKLGVISSWFYKNITDIEKQELRMAKALCNIKN